MSQLVGFLLFVFLIGDSISQIPTFLSHWNDFKATFGKTYLNPQEEAYRQGIFSQRIASINAFNAENHSYKLGVNKFSDMTPEEFNRLNGFNKNYKKSISGFAFNDYLKVTSKVMLANSTAPDTVDWRNQGAVTRIKDQGPYCGSCWAFSATGAIEGQRKIKNGTLVSMSEQNLIDCANAGNCEQGGLPSLAFAYLAQGHGIDTESCYPYYGMTGWFCWYRKSCNAANVKGFVALPYNDENALKTAVGTVGPISVAIQADQLQSYQSGIFNNPNCTEAGIDHAVLAIGYGTDNGTDYWLLKNSWGTSWGEKGFFRISRNANNMCGIASNATYPLL